MVYFSDVLGNISLISVQGETSCDHDTYSVYIHQRYQDYWWREHTSCTETDEKFWRASHYS